MKSDRSKLIFRTIGFMSISDIEVFLLKTWAPYDLFNLKFRHNSDFPLAYSNLSLKSKERLSKLQVEIRFEV